eukprot:7917379-Pyramimonas_sp.AAC.1
MAARRGRRKLAPASGQSWPRPPGETTADGRREALNTMRRRWDNACSNRDRTSKGAGGRGGLLLRGAE